ncbi:MAG: hypothetical protein WCL00_02175 [Bacteroidota bacterium]
MTAYQGMYDFTDFLAKQYEEKKENLHERLMILTIMCEYDATVLSASKLRSQKAYNREMIKKINPHYFEGYFKPRKKQTNN